MATPFPYPVRVSRARATPTEELIARALREGVLALAVMGTIGVLAGWGLVSVLRLADPRSVANPSSWFIGTIGGAVLLGAAFLLRRWLGILQRERALSQEFDEGLFVEAALKAMVYWVEQDGLRNQGGVGAKDATWVTTWSLRERGAAGMGPPMLVVHNNGPAGRKPAQTNRAPFIMAREVVRRPTHWLAMREAGMRTVEVAVGPLPLGSAQGVLAVRHAVATWQASRERTKRAKGS